MKKKNIIAINKSVKIKWLHERPEKGIASVSEVCEMWAKQHAILKTIMVWILKENI